ncbi:MAG: NTP transferase domain-containing protein [Nitrosopumilus sp.]|nr:NTP transferase domain-containing protein [Nitrosopumilus sp.]MBA3971070.1 NTP transferase domain-containing protein [Bacteroidota bacterium]
MSKRAVILAGGKGTRLKPYTVVLPKPLMPIGDFPILEVIIRQLAYFGFDHITLTVNHQAEIIKAFFGDGSKWKIKIDYSLEEQPLSTMGPLSLIGDLPENFLVMNGDILSDINYKEFYDFHLLNANAFTISSYVREQINLYGVLEVNEAGKLSGFKEKPKTTFEVSMGIYMLNKSVLKYIPHNQSYGFDTLMLDMMKNNSAASVKKFAGYWLDIGRPDDYMQAIEEFEQKRKLFLHE